MDKLRIPITSCSKTEVQNDRPVCLLYVVQFSHTKNVGYVPRPCQFFSVLCLIPLPLLRSIIQSKYNFLFLYCNFTNSTQIPLSSFFHYLPIFHTLPFSFFLALSLSLSLFHSHPMSTFYLLMAHAYLERNISTKHSDMQTDLSFPPKHPLNIAIFTCQ